MGLILFLILARPLVFGLEPSSVGRGDVQAKIHVAGTVTADGIFRLKSSIDGRVEQVLISTNSWAEGGQVLGTLANRNLMGMIDATGNAKQAKDVLEGRSQRIYQPTKIACPGRCFVLRKFIKPKQLVQAQAVMIEAAKTLRLLVHIPVGDAAKVGRGQVFEFWPTGIPEKKLRTRIPRYDLDLWGERGKPGGSFELELTPEFYLDPGIPWAGIIYADLKKRATVVATRALIRHEGKFYLPVAVSTGVMSEERTEVIGVEDGRPILILGAALSQSTSAHVMPERPATPQAAPAVPQELEPPLAPPAGE